MYPELEAPVRSVPVGQFEAPPEDVRWIAFKGATIPAQTRDGRKWGNDLRHAPPAPYGLLFLNGKLLLRTPIETDTLSPTWADAPAGNFRVKKDDRFRVEVWESGALADRPIGIKEIGMLDEAVDREAEIECDSGVRVRMAFESAHARFGFGFHYELRVGDAYITRVYEESPAGRAGIKPGDQIVALDGKPVAEMKGAQVERTMNGPHPEGLAMHVRHVNGLEGKATFKEGVMFPLFSEMGTLRLTASPRRSTPGRACARFRRRSAVRQSSRPAGWEDRARHPAFESSRRER